MSTKKDERRVTVVVHEKEQAFIEEEPEDFYSLLQAYVDLIPKEHRDHAKIIFEGDVEILYTRPETKSESVKREVCMPPLLAKLASRLHEAKVKQYYELKEELGID